MFAAKKVTELSIRREMVRVSRKEKILPPPVLTVPHVGCFDFVSVLFGKLRDIQGCRESVPRTVKDPESLSNCK